MRKAAQWRKDLWQKKCESEQVEGGSGPPVGESLKKDFTVMQPGDFFITKVWTVTSHVQRGHWTDRWTRIKFDPYL